MSLRNDSRPSFGRYFSVPAATLLLIAGALSQTSRTGGGGGGEGGLSIVSCSLGCANSASSGNDFSCNVTDVSVNQDIRVTFSAPINLLSVTNNTFQVIETATGMTPASQFSLDPNDPTVLILSLIHI